MIFPKFLQFANKYKYDIKLSPHQNYYPDITFVDSEGNKYAVDLKSTYRVDSTTVNGMTLGAFTGYFRNRESRKNVLFPYGSYLKHYVFGIIYTRSDIYNIEAYLKTVNVVLSKPIKKLLITYINDCTEENWEEFILKVNLKQNSVLVKRPTIDDMLITETDVYNINNYQKISSVVRDFDYFLQEKWKIAIDRPGSGNTKNIGSVLFSV
jgi:Restriction endonuclease EcoRV